MSPGLRHALQAGALLATVALLAVALLAGMERLTRAPIAEAERRAELAALAAVLPPHSFDNDPLHDQITVLAPAWLGSDSPVRSWRARRDGEPVQLVLEVVARNGYAGPIRMLLGVDPHGRVVGLRVTRHQETPGLGDGIELRRSDWITRFNGRSLGAPPRPRWRLRGEGGDFDGFTGATLTPRAVVAATAQALEFVETHGEALYAAPPGATVSIDDAPAPPFR